MNTPPMPYDPERFGDSPVGRLRPTIAGGRKTSAFVPNPLPHAVELDERLLARHGEARAVIGELKGLAFTLANPALMAAPLLRREAVLSSRIEGTRTTIEDLYRVEIEQLKLPGLLPEDEHVEVLNYVKALEVGYRNLPKYSLSLRNIRAMHKTLLTGVRGGQRHPGEFRRTQNWIQGGFEQGVEGAVFVPPPVPEMKEALHDLERYIHSEESDALIAIALSHYQFEAIHPFADGNGRIGRLLLSLSMVYRGLLPSPILYLSGYLEERRERYYDLLLAVSQRGAVREWVEFMLEAIIHEGRYSTRLLRYFNSLQEDWRRRVTKKRMSSLVLRALERLFELPSVTVPALASFLGVKYPSARRTVEHLERAEILVPAGRVAGAQSYVAPEILRAVAGGLPETALNDTRGPEDSR